MKSDLHVSAEESVEATHSLWLDLAISGGIEMFPGLFEEFIHEIIKGLSGKVEMGVDDLLGSKESGHMVHVVFTSWESIIGGCFDGVFHIHGVHELIVTGSWSLEDCGVISAVSPVTVEIGHVGGESWMFVVFIVTPSVKFMGGDSSEKSNGCEFHFIIILKIFY